MIQEAISIEELEQLLMLAEGHAARIASVEWRPSEFQTLFPAEILTLSLANGDQRKLFVKHLDGRHSDHPSKQQRDRELRVYEALLRGNADLPIARCYASKWDSQAECGRLLLEYIDDWNLKYQSLEHWAEAARRLARLHAHFAPQARQLAENGFLLRLDRSYFVQWARRAVEVVAKSSSSLAAELAGACESQDLACAWLESQFQTLVHNDLSPKNVIADRSARPARICIVDWEMAGVGCGLLDLVQLKDGLDAEGDRLMRESYCDALAGTGLLPEREEEWHRLLAACDLQKILYRLARSSQWQLPPATLERWVAQARSTAARIGG